MLESEGEFREMREERLVSLSSPSLDLSKCLRLCILRAFQHYFQYINLYATYMISRAISYKIGWYFDFVRPVVETVDDFAVMVNPLTSSPS